MRGQRPLLAGAAHGQRGVLNGPQQQADVLERRGGAWVVQPGQDAGQAADGAGRVDTTSVVLVGVAAANSAIAASNGWL
jgi:hypothetical protein